MEPSSDPDLPEQQPTVTAAPTASAETPPSPPNPEPELPQPPQPEPDTTSFAPQAQSPLRRSTRKRKAPQRLDLQNAKFTHTHFGDDCCKVSNGMGRDVISPSRHFIPSCFHLADMPTAFLHSLVFVIIRIPHHLLLSVSTIKPLSLLYFQFSSRKHLEVKYQCVV